MTDRKNLSVATRLQRFFRENPGEELSLEDIARKFSCAETTAKEAVRACGPMLVRTSVFRLARSASLNEGAQ